MASLFLVSRDLSSHICQSFNDMALGYWVDCLNDREVT